MSRLALLPNAFWSLENWGISMEGVWNNVNGITGRLVIEKTCYLHFVHLDSIRIDGRRLEPVHFAAQFPDFRHPRQLEQPTHVGQFPQIQLLQLKDESALMLLVAAHIADKSFDALLKNLTICLRESSERVGPCRGLLHCFGFLQRDLPQTTCH